MSAPPRATEHACACKDMHAHRSVTKTQSRTHARICTQAAAWLCVQACRGALSGASGSPGGAGEGNLLKGSDTRHCPLQPDLGLSGRLGTAAHTHTPRLDGGAISCGPPPRPSCWQADCSELRWPGWLPESMSVFEGCLEPNQKQLWSPEARGSPQVWSCPARPPVRQKQEESWGGGWEKGWSHIIHASPSAWRSQVSHRWPWL